MNTYKLTQHNNDTFSVDTGRDYFEPIARGEYFLVSHDIIEHTEVPHPDNAIDELMAIGAMLAGRLSFCMPYKKWVKDRSYLSIEKYPDFLRSNSIRKIGRYLTAVLGERLDLNLLSEVCDQNYTREASFGEVYSSIESGLAKYLESHQVTKDSVVPESYFHNIKNITNWIHHGGNLFHKRFSKPAEVSNIVFDKIQKRVEYWHCNYGGDGLLCVDFDTLRVNLSFTKTSGGEVVL
jgi:hypothetical protein